MKYRSKFEEFQCLKECSSVMKLVEGKIVKFLMFK